MTSASRSGLKIGIRIPPCKSVKKIAELVDRAERGGIDTVTFSDNQMLWREVWCVMTYAAGHSDKITLATQVTNYVTRHPTVVASAIRTVQEIAPGRVRVGVGVGNSALRLFGLKPDTIDGFRASIKLCNTLLEGGSISVGDNAAKLHDHCGKADIYVAAEGPRALATAAELGDGVVLEPISPHSGHLRETKNHIESMATKAGRTTLPKIVVGRYTKVTRDLERDVQALKPTIAYHVQRYGAGMFENAGFKLTVPPQRGPLPDASDLGHPRDREAAIKMASDWVSDEIALWWGTRHCLFGSVDEIVSGLKSLEEQGVHEVTLNHQQSFTMPEELIDTISQEILPRLRAA